MQLRKCTNWLHCYGWQELFNNSRMSSLLFPFASAACPPGLGNCVKSDGNALPSSSLHEEHDDARASKGGPLLFDWVRLLPAKFLMFFWELLTNVSMLTLAVDSRWSNTSARKWTSREANVIRGLLGVSGHLFSHLDHPWSGADWARRANAAWPSRFDPSSFSAVYEEMIHRLEAKRRLGC